MKLFEKLFKLLGRIKEKRSKKEIFVFFLFLLIPNLLRQALYFVTYTITSSTDFIVSFETKAMYGSQYFFLGIFEEVIIGIIFVLFWFNFSRLRFFAYGWVTDAFFDFISVIVWFFVGFTPLQLLGFGVLTRFLLREVILFYFISAPILFKLNINIRKLILGYSVIGLLFLLMILIF